MNPYAQTTFPYSGLTLNDKFKCELFPHQSETIEWMLYREQIPFENIRGGMVFSEMGLGKTLSSLGTVVLGGGITLIVVPAQLVYVWEGEINRHFNNIKYFVYHGAKRKQKFDKYRLMNGDPDIMIVSYRSTTKDVEDEGGPIKNIDFHRIIFDECHYIKNQSTEVFSAVSKIKGTIKWFLSGTPIMNRIHEMYPYLKLLKYRRIKDFSSLAETPTFGGNNRGQIQRQIQRYQKVVREEYVLMQNLLKEIAIRRTKDILDLPKKSYNDVYVPMNTIEREFYETLKAYSKKRVKKLMLNISKVVTSGLLPNEQSRLRMIILQNMLSLILHLRLACCDPLLVIDKIPRIRDMDIVLATKELGNEDKKTQFGDCPVCYNDMAVVTDKSCGHAACKDCWKKLAKMDTMRCFTCFEPTDIINLVDNTPADIEKMKINHDGRILFRSSKSRSILDMVKEEIERGNKVCIVSQWTTYLDKLVDHFKCENRNVEYIRLDGKTPPIKRQKMVDEFQDNKEIKVCFASLGSSAEGITLHSACTMIICDVYWNKAKISQVSDRIHRIGQKRDVTIHSIYMKESIEIRLKELIDKKDVVCKVIVDCMTITGRVESWLSKIVKLFE